MAEQVTQDSLHEHALQADKHLEALATGLASAGADEKAVKAVTEMAEAVRQIASALGKGAEEQPNQPQPGGEQPASIDQAAGETQQMMQQAAAQRQ